MPAVLGDLIQITDIQSLLNQQVLNVYYYRVTSITGLDDTYLSAISTWFQGNVLSSVRAIQNAGLVHTNIVLKNLTNGVDLLEDAVNLPGTGGSSVTTVLPPYVTHTFRLLRESLVTRNGYKRFAGGSEDQLLNGVGSLPTLNINNINAALRSDIVLGIVTVAEPVIVKRPIPNPAVGYEYSSIGDSQYRGIGSQNTRKVGRGI